MLAPEMWENALMKLGVHRWDAFRGGTQAWRFFNNVGLAGMMAAVSERGFKNGYDKACRRYGWGTQP
jgi:hypothetical protein